MPLLVSLRSNFIAEGVRYRAHPDGTVIPDKYRDSLPSSAQIIEDLEEVKPVPRRFRRRVDPGKTAAPKPKVKESSKGSEPETLSQIGDKGVP